MYSIHCKKDHDDAIFFMVNWCPWYCLYDIEMELSHNKIKKNKYIEMKPSYEINGAFAK
jgi:hypothetical protein